MTRLLSPASPLLLASGSPRRREILETLGVPIVVRAADADETVRDGEAPAGYLARVVRAKLQAAGALLAKDASLRGRCAAILVADTSVIAAPAPAPGGPIANRVTDAAAADTGAAGAILGKPGSVDEAERMIARLAGRTHEVWTRFAIGAAGESAPSPLHEETVVTRVTFRPLTPARVRAYAESGEGTDKAGAYAVQGLGAALVSRIEGSYSNVVGLPACEVVVALEQLGLLP
jgi:septum formation protein